MAKLPGWQDIPIGGLIVDAGNAAEYLTGGWRAQRPVVDMDRCTHCLMCWLYCPDVAMATRDGRFTGVDLDHCKGCGVCATVCPPKCITMVEEWRFAEVEA
jgi:2-oxoacid:acceptor oxidoreductase delta subunit (pyruvate/2-ketoisovalerate family)